MNSEIPTAPKGSALAKVYAALQLAGCEFGSGQDWTCPAHEDQRPSLGVMQGAKGVVIHCAAGCETADVLEALGLSKRDLFDKRARGSNSRSIDDVDSGRSVKYVYKNPAGVTVRTVYRTDFEDRPKQIRQSVADKTPWLYRTPELIAALAKGKKIVLVEGEKSVHRLLDYFAEHRALKRKFEITTMAQGGGSGKWLDAYTKFLTKYKCSEVVIIADNDSTGYKHALAVSDALESAGISVAIRASATDGKHDDICEHLDADLGLSDLVKLSVENVRCILAEPDAKSAVSSVSRGVQVPKIWPAANAPALVAQKWLDVFHGGDADSQGSAAGRLIFWREKFYEWSGRRNRWQELEDQQLRKRMYTVFSKCFVNTDKEKVPWTPTKSKIDGVLDALRGFSSISEQIEEGEFTRGNLKGREVISFRDCNYDIRSGEILEKTPALFNLVSYPFEFPRERLEADEWHKFLHSLWKHDPKQIDVLQEWFGYVLSGRLHLHKALVLLGPPRSGKSTIGTVLRHLIGKENVVGPTFSEFAQPFGLSNWLGKSLAVFADARFASRDGAIVAERLLRISAGDVVEVNRKFRESVSTVLPTRLMIISNEFPNIGENSGALLKRFVVLETRESFYEREDTGLVDKLLAELPAILLWAIEGMKRILEREHFTTVESSAAFVEDVSRMMSPISGFVEDCIKIEPFKKTVRAEIYEAYRRWCAEQGITFVPTQAVFGRNLRSAHPEIESYTSNGKHYYRHAVLKSKRGTVQASA